MTGSQPVPAGSTVVLDNGGATIKAGFAGQAHPVKVVPNLVARAKGAKRRFVGDQVELCDDVQGLSLTRPIDRGYVVDWDLEREIWDRLFSSVLHVQPSKCSLVVTEPLFNFPTIQRTMDELVFEDFGFKAYCRVLAPAMGHLCEHSQRWSQPRPAPSVAGRVAPVRGCSLVLDAGFSFSHVVPVWEDCVVLPGVRRINVGGKVLTNVLKESVTYRSINMMDEPFIMEGVKEALCFCSLDPLREDLPNSRRGSFRDALHADYVLPDGVQHKRGFVRNFEEARNTLDVQRAHLSRLTAQCGTVSGSLAAGAASGHTHGVPARDNQRSQPKDKGAASGMEQQVLALGNERFMVPEALFHPSDIGIPQAGLAEAIVSAMEALPPPLHPYFYANIVLIGGSTQFPFFKERLSLDLRPLVPSDMDIVINQSKEPSLCAWKGASLFASSTSFQEFCVTKEEYEEKGFAICNENFSYQTFQ